MSTLLIVLIVILALGAAPIYPYNRGWGWYPSGGLILIIFLILILTGHL